MTRLTVAAALAVAIGAATAAASPATSMSGVVVGVQGATKTLFVADSRGHVFMVLARRVAPVGAVVRIRGERMTPNWMIVATGTDGRLTRNGTARKVLVQGELGFVDIARRRFQVGAHGQVVNQVSFATRFGPALRRLGTRPPQPRSLTFRLWINAGRLSLAALPR